MRDYGIVSPRFWIGETGKMLRGDAESQVLALYLMTCPHSTMTGVFHCPVIYMAHETGLDMQGASKALARLIEVGFCVYEEASETVFVVRMAAYQVGESLKPGDKRVLGLHREVEKMPSARMKAMFLSVYGQAFRLSEKHEIHAAPEAPCKPLRSQEQEQDQDQEENPDADASADSTAGKASIPPSSAPCPADAIIALYHELMPDNPRCKVLNEARRGAIRARWKEASKLSCAPFGYSNREDGLSAWRAFFEVCAESPFLTGRATPQPGKPPFVADIDFLMSPAGFAKTIENKYHREAA